MKLFEVNFKEKKLLYTFEEGEKLKEIENHLKEVLRLVIEINCRDDVKRTAFCSLSDLYEIIKEGGYGRPIN